MEKEKLTGRTKAGAWAAVGGVLIAAMIMTTAPTLTRSADAANATDQKKPNIVVIWGDDRGGVPPAVRRGDDQQGTASD